MRITIRVTQETGSLFDRLSRLFFIWSVHPPPLSPPGVADAVG